MRAFDHRQLIERLVFHHLRRLIEIGFRRYHGRIAPVRSYALINGPSSLPLARTLSDRASRSTRPARPRY